MSEFGEGSNSSPTKVENPAFKSLGESSNEPFNNLDISNQPSKTNPNMTKSNNETEYFVNAAGNNKSNVLSESQNTPGLSPTK